MNIALLLQVARLFAGISIVAIGGANATVPEIHREIVEHLHWMNDQTFVDLIGVAQVAPGPNVFLVSVIGWYVAGPAGFVVATLGMVLPSSALAFFAGRALEARGQDKFWRLVKGVLGPIAVGLILASGAIMARGADRSVLTIAATLGMTLLAWRTRLNPLIGIGTAALVGIIAGRAGWGLF
jgi:chromate transporter